MTRVILAILLAATAVAADRTPGPIPDGMPFGRMGDADLDRLQDFAVKHGFDLKAEMDRVYRTNGRDEDALGRVFMFSRRFSSLDRNARAYGQIIYSSLLNIGEHIGVPAYANIIDRQPADVQQRVRDFLFFPITREAPKSRWEEALAESRAMYPGLFPKGFQFGRDDPIFANET
jgi:hypothetical protein